MAKKIKKTNWKVTVVAIAALTVIECFAMAYGINGTFRMMITAIIAGLAGWKIQQLKK